MGGKNKDKQWFSLCFSPTALIGFHSGGNTPRNKSLSFDLKLLVVAHFPSIYFIFICFAFMTSRLWDSSLGYLGHCQASRWKDFARSWHKGTTVVYDNVSALMKMDISVPKSAESWSSQMVMEKVKWTYFDIHLYGFPKIQNDWRNSQICWM